MTSSIEEINILSRPSFRFLLLGSFTFSGTVMKLLVAYRFSRRLVSWRLIRFQGPSPRSVIGLKMTKRWQSRVRGTYNCRNRLNFALHSASLFKEATRQRINRHRTKSSGWTCPSRTHTRSLLMENTYYVAKVALADIFYEHVPDTSYSVRASF